ncbi:efflux RND transporter periplasmic adaptor subunit [Natronoflexus pectinivorans]|uniref:Cobalt-zinc-cadmium efflux system membrane fusion protein n=1 Tax=Natronoflexus pectinivorans TaxID=682526 RepID=A0A4V6NMR2_9BACT|nr:efflux RND transporter periplasmic adaptor subunit [Natronoflexus pectinivorans]TCO09190.1 cobalt-zinc-cadmium efflux system membrane fusion protein [Natronoflexus pectinivorans]
MLKMRYFLALCVITFLGCKTVVEQQQETVFCIDDGFIDKIELTSSQLLPVTNSILLNGVIQFNKEKVVPFISPLSGQVNTVHFQPGDFVEKGELLATVRSAETAALAKELSDAKGSLDMAERELEMTRRMHESGLASGRDLSEAKRMFNHAKINVEQIEETLQVLGGGGENMLQQIRAPRSGYIVQKSMNSGMYIGSGEDPLFTISDLNDVWVMIDVFESEIAKISEGQAVIIRTIAYPDTVFKGFIDYSSRILDPEKKVMNARATISNSEKLLKPGMFAAVTLEHNPGKKLVAIPSNSLVFDRNRYFVVVANDLCDVNIQEVKIYSQNDEFTFLSSGLEPEQTIISKNQLLIYNQLQY